MYTDALQILMKNILRRLIKTNSLPPETIVSFSGGMGAQIISAGIYYNLQAKGIPVRADLSYFTNPSRIATEGERGECSHWPWQLDEFGIKQSSFDQVYGPQKRGSVRVDDGIIKARLGFEALREQTISTRFVVPSEIVDLVDSRFPKNYLCMHIRRGDYVNVASHLVSDSEFIEAARNFAGLVEGAIIASDSQITNQLRQRIDALFPRTLYQTEMSAFNTHRLMRKARVLICSNSQFSLVGGLLNNSGIVILPRTWFGPGNEEMQHFISSKSDFTILSNKR